MTWLIAFGVVVVFIIGMMIGCWMTQNAAAEVMKAAEATAGIADGYCTRAEEAYLRCSVIDERMKEVRLELTRSADEREKAAKALEAMDRNQGVVLTALLKAGIIGTTGREERGESPYTG